jgi:sodium transport system permease protein
MQLPMIAAVYRKEMMDLLRDRRTLMSMVVIPVLVMPLLMVLMTRVVSTIQKRSAEESKTMPIAAHVKTPAVLEAIRQVGYQIVAKSDLRAAVEKKEISAAVEETTGPKNNPELNVYQDESNPTSAFAGGKIRDALANLKDVQVRAALRKSGVPESVLSPFDVKPVNVAPVRKMAGMIWGSILGYLILLMMFSGGMYPVIDMTAGEKERKTLEPFLSTPIGRGEIVAGKTLAAITAIFTTAVLTLSSMVFSLKSFSSGDSAKMLSVVPLDAQAVILIILTVLPLAVFAASVMIAIAMFARSFKEGQSYLTPLILIVIFPALIGGMPGLKLTTALYLIPIFNASQVIRTILMGEVMMTPFLVTIFANLVYAGIAAYIARTRFENESVLFRT